VAAAGAVIAALVTTLSPGHSTASAAGAGPSQQPTGPVATPTPTVGSLQVTELQVGDCLTGANMELDTSNPWPKRTQAVPCGQAHTAEVFFADNNFWPKNSIFPGSSAITKDGNAACDKAFQSYVGIGYQKSVYTWTNIIPDASTWPAGDRGLHCIAYHATSTHPAGVPMTGSIRGTQK
jgi:Septum formation